ncbi:hypothetical protein ABEB36_006440 [Hypothenemus hampei]|uniref:RING-type E3 ubiquitin transferase n=1 Tax=Hypothenemus hampei TaxID=57062 RepID=A0ABD1EQZ5_HYPHA
MEQLVPKNRVYIDEELKEEYPTVTLSDNDFSAIHFRTMKNLRPYCFHCGDHNLSYGQKYFWHRCANFKHFYCYYCFDYSLKKYNHTCSADGKPILDECKTIEHLLCRKIKFECQWPECKKIFGGSTLKRHEISCDLQPKRLCPVEKCQWSGRIDEMERDHFKQCHDDECKMILRNVVLKLESDKNYYLYILGRFVLVKYVVTELGEVFEHNFDLQLCKDDKLLMSHGIKPVGLVSVNHTLLKKIEGIDSVKSIRKNVVLFVHFEEPQTFKP